MGCPTVESNSFVAYTSTIVEKVEETDSKNLSETETTTQIEKETEGK